MSRRLLPLLASTALFPVSALAQTVPATPAGGTVVAGQATIGSAEAGRLTITQTSAKAAINWESFSVGPGGKVEIAQPTAQSILLNRVTGAAPSTIAGNLTANGHVYLINPNGILITKTGTISAAGLVASTLDITPDALFAADRQIIAGAAGSSIVNDGQIRIAQGGYAALIGGTVRNTGLIAAPMGHVSLAAGATATIDFSGDGFLQVAVPDDGIETVGMLDHGMVAFRPGVAMAAARRVVNLSAANQAVSVTGSDGSVVLSGTVDVASASGLGGDVTVTGRDIALVDATIDASGALGGGRIRIGGDWQGQGDLPRADTLTVDAASTIRADAPQSVDGGSVVLWSDNVTDFRGTVSARSAAGIGGDAEISGKALLNYAGSADLRGLTFGTLLLDPYNITISSAANSNVFGFTPNGNNSVINATLLVNALATANVSISTGTAGSQAGTISLNTNISWQSSSTLTLTASNRISLSGDINAPNGGLALSAGTSIDPLNAINVNRFTLLAGFFSQSRPDGLPAFFARDFRVTGDLRRTSFIRNLGGDGNGDPFIIADIYGLQGLRELNPRVASNALLAQDLDASVTATWNGGQGFQPLGSNGTPWQWNLNGNGRRINNLTINRPTVDNQGLIGLLGTAGSVGRVILSNASIIGQDNVGALVGSGSGAISSSYVEDSSVRGRNQVGGVVGLLTSTGSLNLSFAFADVTGSTAVGGLIGYVNGGSVDQTWSSGAVRGTGNSTQIGGLVGRQTGGAITASYWDIETSGQISSFGGTGLTTAQARRQSSYVGFDFNTSWFQGDGTGDSINPTGLRPVPQTFGPPVFTSGAVLVTNLLQLQIAVRNLTNNIILFNDIDASASAGANPAGIWSSAGFFPLGNAANPFTGSIDGAGSVIRNLTINRPTSNDVGLVGVLSGTVRNVALVDSNITGQNSVGGLVGRALPSANITQSYSAAPITGVDGVGGLVGFNEGQIQNSYASGPVTGALAVGGLVGTNNGSISQAYATGRVTGLQSAGGLVGAINASSSVINGYWDIQTTGLSTSQGGGVGLTTADAQDLNRFRTIWAGFDFNSVWAAPNQVGQNNNSPSAFYPEIFSTSRIVAVNPSGTGFYGNAISPITAQYLGLQPSLRIRLVANGPLISLRSTDRIVSPGTFTAPVSVTSPVGSYAISGSGVQANDSRYRYVYLPSSYEVTPRPVTITADALSRIYGDANPALTYQVGGLGLVNGDTLGGMLATAATTTSNVGSYAITQGSLSASSNYALTYVGSQLSVTPRALTVVSRPQARIYGDANPTLTYQIGGAGLVNGDTLTGLLATTATTTSNVGSYAITQGSLTGGSNYALTYLGGQLLVRQRPLTITADPLSRIYGDANPALTYRVGATAAGTGLVNGDTLSGLLATVATTTSNVGSYAITQGSLSASSNYALTYAGANLSVTPRALTITADPLSRIYGDANPALTYRVGATGAGTGLVNSDTLSGLLATSANTTSNVGSYEITQGTLTAGGNYALSYTGAQLAVTPRALTITADPLSRIYGDANPALTYRVGATGAGTGLVNSDTLSGLLATSATTTSNVGSYAITQGSLSASSNYALTYAGANLSVTPRGLTITADPLSRIYGDANPALTYRVGAAGVGTGLVNGDTLTGLLATTATTTSNVGSYAITQGSLSAGSNYALTYAGANLSVTPRGLTITADPLSRIYGDANPALTYRVGATAAGTGLVNGDTLSGLLATVATTTSNVGSYDITQGSLTAGSNYALTYAGANLSVTPRGLTITADPLSRVYGDANPALTYRVGAAGAGTGLVNGDTLTGLLATTATTTSNVGSYAITQGTLSASSNYALSYTAAQLSVTPRALTITADPLSRIYGDANPALTYQVGGFGLVNGDTLAGMLATSATTASNVGSYDITQGSLTAGSNYAQTYVGGQLSVTPRALTITADPLSRIYGDANPALTYRVGGLGLINGDTLAGLLSTSATTASNIGSYDITQGTLTAGSNYALTYAGGQLTVTPRALTITADPLSRVYGDANPALTYRVGAAGVGTGLVNGDTPTGLLATTATTTSNVGSYAITQGSLTAGSNYALTYAGGQLTVTPRALTITADPLSRIYGDANPALTYRVGGLGLVNGDTLAGLLSTSATTASNIGSYDITQGSLTGGSNYALSYSGAQLAVTPRALTITADPLSRIYGDANPALTYRVGGLGLVNGDTLAGLLSTSATTASNIGSYDITQGTLTAGGNYAISYSGAQLSVTPRGLTITADPLSRIYGDANPALTYQVGGFGLVNGDTLAGMLATSATTVSNVGSYDITQGSLTAGSNYALSYTGAQLAVTPRGLTITADPLSRIYGDANPALTYRVGGLGLVNGDALAGLLSTSATTVSNIGSYDITQGSLTAGSNYALSYTAAQLAVTPRGLTITADPLGRIYGDANPALTYRVGATGAGTGLVNGDTLSGLLATVATTTSNVGSYAITQGTLTAGSNYALSYTGAQLAVTPRGLTITADPLSRVYGDANPALTYRVGGFGLVNGDTLAGMLATSATTVSNVGSYDITQGSLTAGSNYALSYTGAQLAVTPRGLTITADPLSRIYGDANPALTYRVGATGAGTGLVNGDTLSGLLATSANTTSNVGSYDITQGTLTAGGNYAISYSGAQLAVTPRALTITADPLSRIYGDANPALTYRVGATAAGTGLVNGDTLAGMLATSATTASNVGSYDITQGSLTAGGNYALTYVPASLTVLPRAKPPTPLFSSTFVKQWTDTYIIYEAGNLEDLPSGLYRSLAVLRTPEFLPLRVCRKDISCGDDYLAVRRHQTARSEADLAVRGKDGENSTRH